MRSVAKGNYIKGAGGIKHALAHVRYLQIRGGEDRDHALGGKRLFINASRNEISGSEVIERIKQQSEDGVVIHRIVLSPGIPGVDLDNYVRAVLSALKHSKGQDIEYYATKHRNTDHDHSHVMIMGRDEHGKQVRMSRHNYKTVREAADRYLERNHQYDRFLDKDLHVLMRDGYKRDRGDQNFERLLEDLNSPLTFEECDQQRRTASLERAEELSINALSGNERIVRDNVIYTKYSSLEDLLELDRKLVSGELSRLPAEQYQKMWSWIGNKKQFGDDYYVRKSEADRLHQQFDEDLKRSLHCDNSPPKNFKQYIFESRGRLLEWHERYEINTQRSQLQKHIDQLDQSDSEDLEKRNGLIEQLDWLNAMSEERVESTREIPKIELSKKGEKSMQPNSAEARNLFDTEERERWGNELVERAWTKLLGDQPEIYDKASPQGKMAIQEALGREISKLTAEDHQLHKQERSTQEKEEHEGDKEIDTGKSGQSDDLTQTYEDELSLRAWTNVTSNKEFDLYELEPEIFEIERARWREEIEKVYAEDKIVLLPDSENPSRDTNFDDKIEQYQLSVHDRAYNRAFEDRTWDFNNLAPGFKEDVVTRWQEEITRLREENERPIEPMLEPDKEQSSSDINVILYGKEPPLMMPDRDMSQTDQQVGLWQKIAFHSVPNEQQMLDQIMSEQVQQAMQQQIQRSFSEHEHLHSQFEFIPPQVTREQKRDQEQERTDEGREHTR